MAENKLTGRPGRPKELEPTTGEPVDPKERKAYWDARKAKVAALKAEGSVVERAVVERETLAKIAAVKHGLLSQPARYAQRLLSCRNARELQAEWTDINRELLHEFAADAGPEATGAGHVEGAPETDD